MDSVDAVIWRIHPIRTSARRSRQMVSCLHKHFAFISLISHSHFSVLSLFSLIVSKLQFSVFAGSTHIFYHIQPCTKEEASKSAELSR